MPIELRQRRRLHHPVRIHAVERAAARAVDDAVQLCRDALEQGDKLCLCVAFCVGRDGLSPAVQARLDAFHRTAAAWLGDLFACAQRDGSIDRVGDPESEGQACLAQLEGAQLIARAATDVSRFDKAAATLLGRIQRD